MDYFKQVKSFYEKQLFEQFSSQEISLWHTLMHLSNKLMWPGEITVPLSTLANLSGMTLASVKRTRDSLSRKGLIHWKSRNGNLSASYKVVILYDSGLAAQYEPQSEPQSEPIYKHKTENLKPNTKNKIPPTPRPGGWGFGPMLNKVFDDWLQYKAERKEPYKPKGLESLLTQIRKRVEAHGEDAVAEVIQLSMANGWKGIIFDRIEVKTGLQRKPQLNGNIFMDMLREEEQRG